MRARTCGLAALALGILIGAGGCSSDSPTSPLAPSGAAMDRGGIPHAPHVQDTTGASVQGGGYIGGGGRQGEVTTSGSRGGGYIGGGG